METISSGLAPSPPVLLSLASRQVWPQVLVAAQLDAERVLLLHSADTRESSGPARRLETYFGTSRAGSGPIPVTLREVPSDDFHAIKKRLSDLVRDPDLDLGASRLVLHFTGGNKLMATAAYEWAREQGIGAVYLERGNVLYSFSFSAPGAEPRIDASPLDPHLLKDGDAMSLVRAQLEEAVIHREGERLTLRPTGAGLTEPQVRRRIAELVRATSIDPHLDTLIHRENRIGKQASGDGLEYAAAFALLWLGVPVVHRGVELKDLKRGSVQSETDLVFNWGGRLWMVDCKAKSTGNQKLAALYKRMVGRGWEPDQLEPAWSNLKGQLNDTDARLLKEDIQHISEIGGLLGSAIALRRFGVSDDVQAFASSRRPKVEIVYAAEMIDRFRVLLPVARPT